MTLFPQSWRAGMQDVSAAIDDTMGECLRVTPVTLAKPNFPGTPQPDQAVDAIGVFTSKAETIMMGEGRRFADHVVNPLVTTSKPVFSFGYGVLPWTLKQGYRIERLCSGETFEVTNVKPDSVSRIVVDVVQLGRQKDSR